MGGEKRQRLNKVYFLQNCMNHTLRIASVIIRDAATIPHNQTYSSLLANSSSFKKQSLDYVTVLFKDKAATVTKEYTLSVTIDSPSLPSVIKVSSGDFFIKASNQMVKQIMPSGIIALRNILVVSSDTDTWVYGLDLYELGYLDGKHITV